MNRLVNPKKEKQVKANGIIAVRLRFSILFAIEFLGYVIFTYVSKNNVALVNGISIMIMIVTTVCRSRYWKCPHCRQKLNMIINENSCCPRCRKKMNEEE